MSTNKILNSADFSPATNPEKVIAIARPSLSYWKDAWIRLKHNKRALVSLYIISGLLIFSTVGPIFWNVDPATQDLNQISQPPGADRIAMVVNDYKQWDIKSAKTTNNGAILFETPTTQSIRLLWSEVPEASSYIIYRSIMPFKKNTPPGIPLAEVLAGQPKAFEDLLDLTPNTYYYTISALTSSGETILDQQIKAEVIRVITAIEAIDEGYVADDEYPEIGSKILLHLHPFGTDALGRDILSRLMQGARISLFIGVFAPAIFMLFGVIYGSVAGFIGGTIDQVLMRFADFVVALPFLLFMILFKILFDIGAGESGIAAMILAMILLSWPGTARLVRGQVLQIREAGYIEASRLLGVRHTQLILRHILPNTMGVILVTFTFAIPSAIFTEAFLSFIGMGVVPPAASWGSMCNEGIKTMLSTPHELLFPALFISATVLAFNLLGDGLRDALDARLRSSE